MVPDKDLRLHGKEVVQDGASLPWEIPCVVTLPHDPKPCRLQAHLHQPKLTRLDSRLVSNDKEGLRRVHEKIVP